jgi:hypothetical protein
MYLGDEEVTQNSETFSTVHLLGRQDIPHKHSLIVT